ncbi:MAG: hypothetical protein HQK96_08115 [Nitrospirae bacterium]|nr:hypothetical protein [Nitrospirota bacterium]
MPIGNLPDKNDKSRAVVGLVTNSEVRILILNRPVDPSSGDELLGAGYIIEEFDFRDPEMIRNGVIAKQMARAIEGARNVGFEQGRAFVRDALGIKNERKNK